MTPLIHMCLAAPTVFALLGWAACVTELHMWTWRHHAVYGAVLFGIPWDHWLLDGIAAALWTLGTYLVLDDFYEHYEQLKTGDRSFQSPVLRWYAQSWVYAAARRLGLDT